jgi:hypothetical protein
MLDLLLFVWPIAPPEALPAKPEPSQPARRQAPSRQAKAKRPRGRPALRMLEGGRAGMP